ncbi:MAG: TolC family protein [Bdellovibrionia bacterium]
MNKQKREPVLHSESANNAGTYAAADFLLVVVAILFLFATGAAFAQPPKGAALPLDSYLEQVKTKNTGYTGAEEKAHGAKVRVSEGSILTTPRLFANGQWVNNENQTTNPNFTGVKTLQSAYTLGLESQTSFGLSGKLYYGLTHTELAGANPAFVPYTNYYEAKPVLELNQSLWKNGFGREVRATREAIEAGARAVYYLETFTSKAMLAEAEATYWRLSMAREFLDLQDDSLKRGSRLRDWSSRRVKTQLADRSDLLQAEAGLGLRELERQSAYEEERNAARAFNSLRGVDSDEVPESLTVLSFDTLKIPELGETRDDVRAYEENMKAANASAKMSAEKNRPVLDVYAQISRNALNIEQSEAMAKATDSAHQGTVVGVKFNMPLDIGSMGEITDGYLQEAKAAELKWERKRFEAEKDKRELKFKAAETKKRLKLAQQFEAAQKDKYFHEKDRHSKGRTTTFLVLQFEQDLALAQLNRLKVQTELLGLISQMKLYGSDK